MTYTTLHRALGVPAGPVTEQMLHDAVAARVGEAEDLDWKEAVDDGKDSAKEFGKDVAAMANTAGGVIVYGVREDGAGHAAELVGLTNPHPLVQSLRGKAGMVRPFVPALRIHAVPLNPPGHAGDHAIVVEIPRSPDAPHLVPQSKESWGLPRRRGSDTDWLGESDLETAYADRFARRRAADDHLADLAGQLSDRLTQTTRTVWVTVAAACSVPSAADTADAVDPNQEEPSLVQALDLLPNDNQLRDAFDRATVRPRTGLRRAVVSSDNPYNGTSTDCHLELLHDGSFAAAMELGEATYDHLPGTQRSARQGFLEVCIRDLVTVAAVHASRRGADGMLQVQVGIVPTAPTEVGPVGLIHRHPIKGSPELVPNSITLSRVVPATAEAPLADAVSSDTRRQQLTRELALDMVQQFAVPTLRSL
ncbi:ATP-binding protein [Kitasatospora cinereorecta]|uniref:ATP-binding protein n=1 Tax=Kitasatospora cinereorecta TaxID=285560 RepID=A0ABW0VJR3_9ACTN